MTTFLPILPICIALMGLLVALSDFIPKYRRTVYKKKSLHSSKGGFLGRTVIATRSEPRLASGTSLNSLETSHAFKSIVSFAIDLKPDYIIGLNRGGVLIGAYISLASATPSSRFHRCAVVNRDCGLDDDISIECTFQNLRGKVLVVDDIVRTGKTLKAAVDAIKNNPDNKSIKLYSAALVTAVDRDRKKVYESLDFVCFVTEQGKDFKLPWTEGSVSLEEKSSSLEESVEVSSVAKSLNDAPINDARRDSSIASRQRKDEISKVMCNPQEGSVDQFAIELYSKFIDRDTDRRKSA